MITNQKLEAALKTLENFTQNNSLESVPHIFHPEVSKGSTFQKILSLIKASFSEKIRQNYERQSLIEESEVLYALSEVEKNKELACRLSQTISEYNAIVERAKMSPQSWENRLLTFLYKKSNLSLSRTHSFELKVEKSPVQIKQQLPPSVLDPFRTKAISLLKDRGIFPTVKDILESVKNTPIESVETDSTIILTQKLSETVIIRGVFERLPNGSRPKSFSIQQH